MPDLVIDTTGLRKIYGSKVAVADLTLQVPKGEVFGFLGPNGAGKSTSVKMLLGLVAPTSGVARVLGQAPGHTPTMGRLGFLPEHFRFHEWLQAAEFLDLHGRLLGMDRVSRRHRIPELLDQVGLTDQARRPLAGFSKGMLQRVGLAQALLNNPELVFLDEPTSALDPFGRRLVRRIIRDLAARGTTVFLNSHLLGEVEATCDRVAFIKAGRVLRTLGLHDLEMGLLHVELRVNALTPELTSALQSLGLAFRVLEDGPSNAPRTSIAQSSAPAGSAQPLVRSNGSAAAVAEADGPTATLELTLTDEQLLPVIAERALASGARLYALTPRRLSLEQLFLDVVGTEDSGQ